MILNIDNNHRVMIKNSKLCDFTVHNLSKFASAKGLRENLKFKIGYDVPTDAVRDLFETVYERVKNDSSVEIEDQHELEFGIIDTGYHAIEWVFYYYTKEVDKLMSTCQRLLKLILETSIQKDISLSMPITTIFSTVEKASLPISE